MPRTDANSHRSAVLDAVRTSDRPLGVSELAERLGIHPNTARFHLDALVAEGLVDRRPEPAAGRGRPRAVHVPHPGMDRGGQRRYQLLARILLDHLAKGPDARRSAIAAGKEWGAYLVDDVPPSHRTSTTDATRRLSAMMSELGFAPDPTDGRTDQLRLRHCPFLELAEENSDVLCPLHLGLMQGALREIRAPIIATDLEPFAEPDACLVHLSPKSGSSLARQRTGTR